MSAGEYCNREVVVAAKTDSIREVIGLMRQQHTGDVVVVEKQGDLSVPLGILTDRDIVVEILGENVDLDSVNVGDVMSDELVTVGEDIKFIDAIKRMKTAGVRRMPVVNDRGGLVGILTVDDVLALIAEEMDDIVSLISREQKKERKQRKPEMSNV